MNQVRVVLAVVAGICWLAACDSPESPALPPSTVIQLPSISADIIVVPGCELEVLENWYEVAVALQEAYQVESVAALDLPAEQFPSALVRLADIQQRLAEQPVPECVAVAHGAALSYIERAGRAFEAYSRKTLDYEDMRQQVLTAVEGMRQGCAGLMAAAEARLRRALEERQATLAVGSGP